MPCRRAEFNDFTSRPLLPIVGDLSGDVDRLFLGRSRSHAICIDRLPEIDSRRTEVGPEGTFIIPDKRPTTRRRDRHRCGFHATDITCPGAILVFERKQPPKCTADYSIETM